METRTCFTRHMLFRPGLCNAHDAVLTPVEAVHAGVGFPVAARPVMRANDPRAVATGIVDEIERAG